MAFPLDEQLLAALDRARGARSRSAVVREAIYSMLKAQGYQLPPALVNAPDRVGKGGRPKKVVEMPTAKVAEDESPLPPTPMKNVKYPRGKKL